MNENFIQTPEEIYKEMSNEKEEAFVPRTEREVLISCSGEDEYGNSKAIVSVKLADVDVESGRENVLEEIIVENSVVNIFRSAISTMVDLTFLNPMDSEFVNLVSTMQDFCKADMQSPNPNCLRTIVVTVVPREFDDCYCAGLHASWVIQPSKVGVVNDTVRFIIDSDYFQVLTVDYSALETALEENQFAATQ